MSFQKLSKYLDHWQTASPKARVQGARVSRSEAYHCTPQWPRGEAQRRNRAFGKSPSRTDGFAQSPSSRRASLAERGVLPVRRNGREAKRNAEIGLSANHQAGQTASPKARVQGARVSRSEAYSLYAAATARRSATPKSGFRRSRHRSLKSVAGGSRNAVRTAGSAATRAVNTISGNESASVDQSTVYRKVHPNDCRLIT